MSLLPVHILLIILSKSVKISVIILSPWGYSIWLYKREVQKTQPEEV